MDQITTEQILWTVATLAGALVSAGWAWYIAVQKNRWWYEGFWMGLSLGPFGVIAAACMPMGEPVAVVEPSNLLRARDDHEHGDEQVRRYLERQPEIGSTAPAPPAEKRYTDEEWAKRTPKDGAKPPKRERFPMF
jgi:hypothetical protein